MSIVLIVIAIFFCIFCTIRPFKVWKIPINMATGPLLALFVLLILQIVDIETIRLGILGDGQLQPWEIIVIFFSAVYVSISTDITGFFDFLAYKITKKAKGNGYKLFLLIYIFTCVITVFTSNDIDILTLTPIIFYLGKHAKINVIPLLFAQFFATNIVSMFFYTGNPTNIIVANSLGLGFLEYTQVMWLPTLIALVVNFVLLFLYFRKSITRKYSLRKKSHFKVRNWADAIISATLLVGMLVALGLSDYIHVPIWIITLVSAIVFIFEDICFGIFYKIKERTLTKVQLQKGEDVYGIPEDKNEFFIAIRRVPWKILPFIVVLFVFVQGLSQYGVVDYLAYVISSFSTSLASGIAINGFAGIVLANIINNQPMTILFSSILTSDSFIVSDLVFQGSAYAVVIASNIAASVTIVGALAGIMWKKILGVKGLKISYLDFLKVGLTITPIVFISTLITLYFSLI